MTTTGDNPREIRSLSDARSLIDTVLANLKADRLSDEDRRDFLRKLLLSKPLQARFETAKAIDYLFSKLGIDEWLAAFAKTAEKVLPEVVIETIDAVADVGHAEAIRLGCDDPKILVGILKKLDAYLSKLNDETRFLRGMRGVCIQADVYRQLVDPKIWRRRKIPPFCLDNLPIVTLKEERRLDKLPEAYEARIVQLQRRDMCMGLEDSGQASSQCAEAPVMQDEDFATLFAVRSPLRLGISSANASDNHIRTKEQGGKTLNAGIDLCMNDGGEFAPPLQVSARRLEGQRLVLRSESKGFEADFEINARGEAAIQSDLFFAYRRGGDEALRMVKEGLVHTGIVKKKSSDVCADITRFTGGGGLEIVTSSKVLQGSGLGTSSILAAAILKVFYRLTGHLAESENQEYPQLYDQSVLLEQNLGLNSGWQDAHGARGGVSAVKTFYAPPTDGPPKPAISFVEVNADHFVERVVLFDTGISRAATRGLNVVLDAYLRRDRHRYPALRESLSLHDDMVSALRAGDYDALGEMATRYWQLRCILDPNATNETLQHLFEGSEIAELCAGGMLTGAGGGGFAFLVAANGATYELKQRLAHLHKQRAFSDSRVVDYRLNSAGLKLTEYNCV